MPVKSSVLYLNYYFRNFVYYANCALIDPNLFSSVSIAFIARDKNNKGTTAASIIDTLKSKNVYEKLQKDGMVVTDLKGRMTFWKGRIHGNLKIVSCPILGNTDSYQCFLIRLPCLLILLFYCCFSQHGPLEHLLKVFIILLDFLA